MIWLYILPAFATAYWVYRELDSGVWMAPRFVVPGVALLAGVFWWVVVGAVAVEWIRKVMKRGCSGGCK